MNQHSVKSGTSATRAPVFFRITVGLLATSLLGAAAAAVLLVFQAKNINSQGGWGWLLVMGIFVVAIVVVGFVCALTTAISLFRREPHRRLSIAIPIIYGLIVWEVGPIFIHTANRLRHQSDDATRKAASAQRPPVDAPLRSSIPPAVDESSNTPVTRAGENQQILELKFKLWEAIRARNADAFVDCFFIEGRFDTPELRQENRRRIEILLRGETIDVEVRDIPTREMNEIIKIQNAGPASLVRYSLLPRKML